MDVTELLLIFRGSAAPALLSIRELQGGLNGLADSGSRTNGILGAVGGIGLAAAKVVGALGIAAAATGVASLKAAADFQAAMTLIQTQAGASAAEVDWLKSRVLALAPAVGIGPTELAKGLYHIESLGYRGAKAMDLLTVAAKATQIGGADLEQTTSAIGAAMVTGISGTENLDRAMGLLDATVGAGNMRMEEMVSGLSTGVLPVFKNAGLSLQDYGAALATLTDNGMKADEASTRLRMTVALMAAPSGAASKALKEIGLSSTDLGVTMREKGLVPALQEVKAHLEKTFGPNSISDLKQYLDVLNTQGEAAANKFAMSSGKAVQTIVHAFGGGRSSAAIQTLLSQVDRVDQKFHQIGDQAGQFDTKFGTRTENLNFKVDQFKAKIGAAAVDLGTRLIPVAEKLVPIATDLATKGFGLLNTVLDALQSKQAGQIFSNIAHFVGELGKAFSAAFRFIKPAIDALGQAWHQFTSNKAAMDGLATLLKAIAAIAGAGLVGAVYLVVGALMVVMDILTKVGVGIHNLGVVVGWLQQEWGKLPGQAKAIWDAITKAVGDAVNWIIGEIPKLPEQIGFALGYAFGKAVKFGADLVHWATTEIPKFIGGVIEHFQELPGKAAASFMDLIAGLGAWIIGTAVPWAGREIPKFVKSVTDELGKLPDQALQIGIDMVNGVINGIKNTTGKAISAVGDFVKGLVAGAQAANQSRSPSQLWADKVGAPSAQGFAKGLLGDRSAENAVMAKVKGLATIASGAASGSGASGRPGSGRGQQITNNFYGDVKPKEGDRMGRDIAWRLKTA